MQPSNIQTHARFNINRAIDVSIWFAEVSGPYAQANGPEAAAKIGILEGQQAPDSVYNRRASSHAVKEEDVQEPPSHAKGGKAALKKLRLQLAAQEGKMRQTEAASAERREAMRRETQLLADSLREVGLRCHMLLGKHKMLLDDRKRLEAEA
ncbi:unnamed protein product [Symbiodinium necroappetens]|uniref:Uncharacterized protein n=1 Tax=Symbiodinium necroappetens TaxID=1628268 RepID=A0A812ZXY3_9DINO|nr:unnamed protein product [Symbiodinium necroappetens]